MAPPGGGQEGQVAPTLSFWAVFPVRANPLRKFFEGIPPELSSVCCSTNETSRENVLYDLEILFCFRHKLTRLKILSH